jgi:hypothetical protein
MAVSLGPSLVDSRQEFCMLSTEAEEQPLLISIIKQRLVMALTG